MTSNGQKKTLEVFKDLFLKPGLPSTYSNLQLWAQSSGYPALAEEAKEAAQHPEETEAEFNRLCIGPYRLIVVPYESAWVTGSRKLNGPVAEDVANFYAAAGLSSASLLNELPDFSAMNLSFFISLMRSLMKCAERGTKSSCSKIFKVCRMLSAQSILTNGSSRFWTRLQRTLVKTFGRKPLQR